MGQNEPHWYEYSDLFYNANQTFDNCFSFQQSRQKLYKEVKNLFIRLRDLGRNEYLRLTTCIQICFSFDFLHFKIMFSIKIR